MEPFASAFRERWIWRRPSLWSRRYVLSAGGRMLAALEARTWRAGVMHGTTANGGWTVRHEGLLGGRVLVRADGATEDALVFRPRWFGSGDVRLPDDQALRWHRADFWGRRWELVDSGGLARVTLVRTPAFVSPDAEVQVSEAAERDPLLEPLVLLGYALIVLMVRQNTAAIS